MAAPRTGKVWLVGAGPGDPGLLTLRGRDVLARADAVVHDLLANPELLELAPAGARRINAGKRAGAHVLGQEETNALLVRLARAGKRVVRLKGGDPFVFGRGGEEALALAAAGVPFEVVPGVSSGVAAPAYAGIPITHRGLATAAVFVTGQERSGRPLRSATLARLAGLDATLVFFMATGSAERVAEGLIRAGKSGATPAACVTNGTLPGQRTVVAPLKDLPRRMREEGLGAPGLLVVGPVAGLRRSLAWFETRPLFGRRYLVTRAREQGGRLAEELRALGADARELPLLRYRPLPLDESMRAAFARLRWTDWLVLTSANGVAHLFERLAEAGLDARALAGVRVAAVGSATARALVEHGVAADLVPETYDGDHLLKALLPRLRRGGRRRGVLLARAAEGSAVLPEGLARHGVACRDLHLYRALPVARSGGEAAAALEEGGADGVVFTSSAAVERFRALFPRGRWSEAAPRIRALCLGPVTRGAAEAAGMAVDLESPRPLIADLVAAIERRDGAAGRGRPS